MVKLFLLGVPILLGLGAVILWIWAVGAARGVERMKAELLAGPAVQIATDLPPEIRSFAERGLAGASPGARAVVLEQAFRLRRSPDEAWQDMKAEQVIALGQAGFVWDARQPAGPLTAITVLDAYVEGKGQLTARLLGAVPVANASGDALDLSEAMRYLAELPWAPDAILGNPDLRWSGLAGGRFAVSLDVGETVASVVFTLNEAGDIAGFEASGRPAETGPDGAPVLRDWRGTFGDYQTIGGRRVPLRGEVGYVYKTGYAPYWIGQLTFYRVAE